MMTCALVSQARQRGLGERVSPVLLLAVLIGGCAQLRAHDRNARYIAFGDSATAGPSQRNYTDILRESLDEPCEAFANEGRGGETTEAGLCRLRKLLADDRFPNAEVLLYWQGGGDLAEFIDEYDPLLEASPDELGYPLTEELTKTLTSTQGNIELAITTGQDAGLEVLVATYYLLLEKKQPCSKMPSGRILPHQAQAANAYLRRLNEQIRAAAEGCGANLVDIEAAEGTIRAAPANYFDCTHLSEQGNRIAAEVFLEAIRSADGVPNRGWQHQPSSVFRKR